MNTFNKMLSANKLLLYSGFIIVVAMVCAITTLYLGSDRARYLSESELTREIVGKTGIHNSLDSSNRSYNIKYNGDSSFKMDTIQNGSVIGITTGEYKIVTHPIHNYGMIDVTYENVFESPHAESTFNMNNPNSVFKTMKNELGPFKLIINGNRSAHILDYKCGFGLQHMFITMYDS